MSDGPIDVPADALQLVYVLTCFLASMFGVWCQLSDQSQARKRREIQRLKRETERLKKTMTRDEIIKYALEYSRNRGFGGPEPALPPIGGFEMAKYEPEREKHHWHSGILGIAVLAGRLEINLETLDAATLSEMASDASKTFLAGAAWGYPCPVDSAIMDLDSAVSAATEF